MAPAGPLESGWLSSTMASAQRSSRSKVSPPGMAPAKPLRALPPEGTLSTWIARKAQPG